MNQLRFLVRYLRPRVGRLSTSQMQHLGQTLAPPAYFAVGPLIVLVDLPERLQKADPVPTLDDINAAARRLGEELARRLRVAQQGGGFPGLE